MHYSRYLVVVGVILINLVLGCPINNDSTGKPGDDEISIAFRNCNLVPDILDAPPKRMLTVIYSSDRPIMQGEEVSPSVAQQKPTIKYDAESNQFFTLLMTDPDVPCLKNTSTVAPKNEWKHWMIVNIPGNSVTDGNTTTEYIGPLPQADSERHRYVVLLFAQQNRINFDEPILLNKTLENRAEFSTKKFIEKYKLGDPVAGIFFHSKHDDSVDRQLQTLLIGSGDSIPVKRTRRQSSKHIFSNDVTETLNVTYPRIPSFVPGDQLVPESTSDVPTLTWRPHERYLYTIVMVDFDGLRGQYLHWLVINIPDSESFNSGIEIVEYKGPQPHRGTGLHRYFFLLYRHNTVLRLPKYGMAGNQIRQNFDVKIFAKHNKLGSPVAVNYFRAQYQVGTRNSLEYNNT